MFRPIVLFRGPDLVGSGISTLWETDGTAAGTFQMPAVAGAYFGDVNPSYITAYNNEALFEGIDSSSEFGLWVTDGTAAGTTEIGGIGSTGVSGANPNGLIPEFMTVYNGKVLFRGMTGVAGDDVPSLWITDGTVGGTTEIGGVANAGINNVYSGGLTGYTDQFLPFNGIVLFRGEDAMGQLGLWTTDGTAANTFELAPIAGAAFGPSAPPEGYDIQPQYMTVLGNKVIFDGADQQDTPGSLWVTDGTAAGTVEIGGQGNAGISGSPNGFTGQFTSELPHGIIPDDLTTFGSKVVFAGYDNTLDPAGYYVPCEGLWTTDGTANGTTEIGGLGNAGINGANSAQSGGIFWEGSIEYPDFTVFNNIVLFVGYDSSNWVGLWETDGTASGTKEIGGAGNAGISGFTELSDSSSPDFTVFNGGVLFTDGGNLWETDGTASGTHSLGKPTYNSYPALGPDFTIADLPVQATSVTSGEVLNISAGQTSNGVVVLSGGVLNVLSGGTASGTLDSGGVDNVSRGGTALATTVGSGGREVVSSGGTTSGAVVSSGGTLELLGGAILSGTPTIAAGGVLEIASGYAVSSYVVGSGITLEVASGGIASGTTVSSGGTLELLSGAVVSGTTTVKAGGIVEIASGYVLSNYGVGSGVTLEVASAGSASGATVSSGGTVEVFDGGRLAGSITNNGTVSYDIASSATFSGTLTSGGTLVVSGGGALKVVSAYTGAAQIDDASTLEFAGAYVGVATFSGSSTGSGGTLKLDVASTGPINVVNPNDTVIAQSGGNNWINAAASYTLPTHIDALFLYAGSQGTGNSDASGDALYALDAGNAQTLAGNSPNDTFVVYNSSDVVVPKAGSHDVVYAAASYTLPTGVDALILEGTAPQGVGNSDAAGDGLYAANPGQVATLTGNSPNDTFVVYNSSDVVVPKAGSHDVVYSAVNYTLPTGVDILILEAGTQAVGNSDAAGDALYAANAGIAQTLTGNSANDTFVVYNAADVVVPKAASHDIVYAAVNYTLPTGVDTLFLEAGTQAIGNSDVAGDKLYAANAGIAQTLTGHSHNDTFVVYNAGDTVIGQAGSTDTVYAAANFTLPTNVDTLFLEGNASHGTGNNDAADTLFGNGGVASTLVAGSGADLLVVAGTAGTILTGGTGHDTFAFPNAMGKDVVTNFGFTKDTLQFNMTLFSNFTAAMNHASQSGANTVFTIDANDTVTLDNVTKTSLTAGNFHFT